MMMKTNPAASAACKASAMPRFGASGRVARARAAVVVPRAAAQQYYYSTAVANGTPPAPLSLSATSNSVDDNFAKLNAAYYKTFVTATTAEGEAIQLFTPYRTILADSDSDLLLHMDGKPQFNLVVTNDNIPRLMSPNKRLLRDTTSVPEPGAGYYSVYKGMLGDFKTAEGASKWIDLMQKDGQWGAWTAFRKLPENKGKLVTSKLLKSFVFGPDYEGVLAEQVYQAYVQNSLQLPGSAISNMADFRDSDPPPSATDYYQTSFKDVYKAIQSAQNLSVDFSFKQQTTDLSKTWAEGRIGGAYNMFSASASGSYDKLSEKITKSEISIKITMDRLGTVVVDGKQGPWYQLSALTTARNKESGIFQNDQQFYNHFNTNGTPKGDMVYSTSELVVAMGVNVDMQIKLELDDHEFEEIKAAAKVGFWPFFSASGSGGHTTDVTQSDRSTLRIVQGSTDPKQLFILGRKVLNVYDL